MLPAAEAAASEAARVGARLGHLEPGSDPRPELRQLLQLTAENRSSMAEDLARGRRTEIDAIVGSVVRAARGVGEPVPELERLWAAVLAREATARQGSV
jgi:2-dehydropantoate 2-reductase